MLKEMIKKVETVKSLFQYTCSRCYTRNTRDAAIIPTLWTELREERIVNGNYHLCSVCASAFRTFMEGTSTYAIPSTIAANKKKNEATDCEATPVTNPSSEWWNQALRAMRQPLSDPLRGYDPLKKY